MTELVLLTKIYNAHQMKQMSTIISDLIGDLSVQAAIQGTLNRKWVQVEVSGEDEAVAIKLLEREIGFCPVTLEKVKKFGAFKGYVMGLDEHKEELLIDIGVVEPKTVSVIVPLNHLQTHLTDGKKVSLQKISEAWGLCSNLPLEVKILEADTKSGQIKAELQASQIKKLKQWKDSLLDRLIVTGASAQEVNAAIALEHLGRDVIETETLGTFEHALVCKLGTDAAGLIGRIGRRMRKAQFTVFNPRKISF
jgi:hypothetical protein